MIHVVKGFEKILKSGNHIVRIRIPGLSPEFQELKTNFFLKCMENHEIFFSDLQSGWMTGHL